MSPCHSLHFFPLLFSFFVIPFTLHCFPLIFFVFLLFFFPFCLAFFFYWGQNLLFHIWPQLRSAKDWIIDYIQLLIFLLSRFAFPVPHSSKMKYTCASRSSTGSHSVFHVKSLTSFAFRMHLATPVYVSVTTCSLNNGQFHWLSIASGFHVIYFSLASYKEMPIFSSPRLLQILSLLQGTIF